MKSNRKIRNIALQAFPRQAKALRPEIGKSGGVKAHSGTEEARLAVYRPIAKLYLQLYPVCDVCIACMATEIHHRAKRDGLLLFDTRYWASVCRGCHISIHADEAKAKKEGWILNL